MTEHICERGEAHLHYTVEEVFSSEQCMVRGFVEKNYSKVMHSQAFYEINIVLKGEATHYIGERTLTVSKGDVFIIPPDMPHGYDGGEGFDVYHILLSPRYLEKYAASFRLLPAFSLLFKIDPMLRAKTSARLHFRLDGEQIAALSPRLEMLTARSYKREYTDALVCEGETLILIAELCDMCERCVGELQEPEREDAAFLLSVSHLYRHYHERLTIDTLARIAQMSRNAYIETFKRVMGAPPARFLRAYRIEIAKQMLLDTTFSESEIARAVGCVDVSHLIKLFSAEIGVTPSSFRKSVAKVSRL